MYREHKILSFSIWECICKFTSKSYTSRRKPGHAEAGSKTHVRQSVLYSERKRQPRRERGGTQPPTLL